MNQLSSSGFSVDEVNRSRRAARRLSHCIALGPSSLVLSRAKRRKSDGTQRARNCWCEPGPARFSSCQLAAGRARHRSRARRRRFRQEAPRRIAEPASLSSQRRRRVSDRRGAKSEGTFSARSCAYHRLGDVALRCRVVTRRCDGQTGNRNRLLAAYSNARSRI